MRTRDPAKIAKIQAEYYQRHKEEFKARRLAYYAANREKLKEAGRAYRKANRAKINAYKRSKAKFRIRAKAIAEKILAKLAA